MQIKKSSLEILFNFTKGTEGVLNLADSRVRDSFLKPLSEITQTYYDDRNKIYVAFCLKKEDGSPDLLDGDKYQFDKTKLDEINKELLTLADESVEVNFTDNPQRIKQILEKSDYKPKVGESEAFDTILNAL
jgi:hypothetical protein